MENKDLVSIIIPVYNVEKYINKCIDSIINQTYTNLEIIFIDDGSFDNCPKILDDYAKQDKRIKVIHEKNGGAARARNIGIEKASGNYIAFVDSDDYIKENYIEKMYDALILNNADMAICNFNNIEEDGNIYNNNSPIKNEVINNKDFFKKMTQTNGYYYIVPWNKLYSKKIISNIRFPEGRIHEDEFVMHLFAYNCKKIVSIDDKLYYYIRRYGGVSGQIMNEKYFDVMDALLQRIDFYIKTKNFEYIDLTLNELISRFYVNKAMFNKESERVKTTELEIKKTIINTKKYIHTLSTKLKISFIKIYELYIKIRFKNYDQRKIKTNNA